MLFSNLLIRYCFIVFSAVASLLTLDACSKKEAATPTTGGITGTLTPVDGATSVTLTDQSNNVLQTTVPDAKTGTFTFSNVNVGGYFLNFVAGRGYVNPGVKTATVVGGQTVDVGSVKIQGDGTPHGVVSWRVNGVDYRTTNLSGYIHGSDIVITGTVLNGTISDAIDLRFVNHNYQAGTYVITRNIADPYAFNATYSRYDLYTTLLQYGTSFVPSSATINGTLSLNAFDPTAKTLRGDFEFLGALRAGSGPASPVTNGTFDLYY